MAEPSLALDPEEPQGAVVEETRFVYQAFVSAAWLVGSLAAGYLLSGMLGALLTAPVAAPWWAGWVSVLLLIGVVLCLPRRLHEGRRSPRETAGLWLCFALYAVVLYGEALVSSTQARSSSCLPMDYRESLLAGGSLLGLGGTGALAVLAVPFQWLLLGGTGAPRGLLALRWLCRAALAMAGALLVLGLVYGAVRPTRERLLQLAADLPPRVSLPAMADAASQRQGAEVEYPVQTQRAPLLGEPRSLRRQQSPNGAILMALDPGDDERWHSLRCEEESGRQALTLRAAAPGVALVYGGGEPLAVLRAGVERLLPVSDAHLRGLVAPPRVRLLGAALGLALALHALWRGRRVLRLLSKRPLWRSARCDEAGRLRFGDGTAPQPLPKGVQVAAGPVVVIARTGAIATYRDTGALALEAVLPGTPVQVARQLQLVSMAIDAYALAALSLLGAPLWAALSSMR